MNVLATTRISII